MKREWWKKTLHIMYNLRIKSKIFMKILTCYFSEN